MIFLLKILIEKGLTHEIQYIFQHRLLATYNTIIRNTNEEVKKSFIGLLDLHKNLLDESDLNIAFSNLEKKMDEKSFENLVRIKKESINKK